MTLLVMGPTWTEVYNTSIRPYSRGEISDLTSLIYEAREHALGLIRQEADALGADDVVGIRTHIHELGNLIEFMPAPDWLWTSHLIRTSVSRRKVAIPTRAGFQFGRAMISPTPASFNCPRGRWAVLQGWKATQ